MTDKTPTDKDETITCSPGAKEKGSESNLEDIDPDQTLVSASLEEDEATIVRPATPTSTPSSPSTPSAPSTPASPLADPSADPSAITEVFPVDTAIDLADTGMLADDATVDEHTRGGTRGQSLRYAASDSRGFTMTRNPLTNTDHKPYTIGGDAIKDRFIIEKVLGQGGMGMVCQALDLRKVEARDDAPYIAIKLLSGAFSQHGSAFISLQREAKKTQALAHPNIITVYDFDRDGDTIFMTMEELDGHPLDAILKGKTDVELDFQTGLNIVREIALALEYAHSKGIIHSDLKPGNIFYTNTGVTKVLDFGIARALNNELYKDSYDAGELHALTPKYASLGMFDRDPPDPKDDIYALGLIAGELIGGGHPYHGAYAPDVYEEGLKPELDPKLGVLYRRLITKAADVEPERRTQSASDFLSSLQWAEKGPRRVLVTGVLVLALIIGNAFLIDAVDDEIPLSDLPAADQQLVKDALAEADTALKFSDYNGALIYLDRAYQIHPSNDDVEERADSILDIYQEQLEKTSDAAKLQFLMEQLTQIGEYGFIADNENYRKLQLDN